MNRWLMAGLGALWFGLVFLISFYLTFPTDAIKERIRFEVHDGSGGEYNLEMESVTPWWVGLALHDVKLYAKGRDPATGEMGDQLAFLAGRVRARSTLTSLMAQTPSVNGTVDLLDGASLTFAVDTAMNKKGTRLEVTKVVVDGPQLPIADLGAAAGVVGSGEVDITIDLGAPDGLRSADGKIAIKSGGMSISEVGDMLPPLGFDIPIERVDIAFDVSKGRARVKRGRIDSGFGSLEIEGEITLKEDVGRSAYRFTVVVSDLTPPDGFGPIVEGAMASAKWNDDTYHYSCSGTLERPRSCVAQRERSSRTTRSTTPRTTTPTSRNTTAARRTGSTTPAAGTAAGANSDSRSEDLRERMRLRREEREQRLKDQADEREDLGYEDDDGFDELEEVGYEDAEEALEEFFENDVPIEELERAFEEAFEE
ncbi:MAG: type II secretion system protein N [Myxococcota bacterium]|jgi:type II secretion system protein N